MANGDNNGNGFGFGKGRDPGDRNRDGVDDDFDRRPGNTTQSRSYARRYDPRSEQEFGNRPEIANQIEAARILSDAQYQRRAAREAFLGAQQGVHFFPDVGKFTIPKENTWAAHAELVKDTSQNLYFRPEKFAYFDKIIAEKIGTRALTDPKHRDYAKYEGLRTNLAVLRNDIIGMYVNDGSFDPGDEKFIPAIASIANALGDSLANDVWYKRPFTRSMSVDVANVEGIGAREMYKHLLTLQMKPAPGFTGIRAALMLPNNAWGLPPLEQTPFSSEALAAPPPTHEICMTPGELASACAQPDMQDPVQVDEARPFAFAENALRSAQKLKNPDSLPAADKNTSVDEARTILRWLRNLQFTDQDVGAWLSQGTQAEQESKGEQLSQLVSLYQRHLTEETGKNPQVAMELAVQDANDAASGISLAVASHILAAHPQNPLAADFESLAAVVPASGHLRQDEPVSRLLSSIEQGFSYVASQDLHDQSPADRLLEMGDRTAATARRVRSVATMKPPAREESIELAREILRKLKNLTFSDKTVKEMVDTGRPEDKAALATKLTEMADIYENLLSEAALANPDILSDPRIKDANDAVGSFAHAIKLMAAKEMPGSVASAQQISADITQMPEEWKHLHDHTVGRLLHSMEGGLEKAVGDIEQQQEQDQDEEITQSAVDTALHSEGRKRRRKRKQSRSGFGGAKQRKQNLELAADDYVLKQGRHAPQHPEVKAEKQEKQAAFMHGLRPEDIAAIKSLGGNLRDINQQAQSLSSAPATEPVAPDDRTLAAREREQRNPKGSQRDRI